MTAPWLLFAGLLPGFATYTTSQGATAHWDTATFCYEMSDAVPEGVDVEVVEGLLSSALRTWTDLDCAPKTLTYQGRTPKTHVDPDQGSGNTVVWVADPADWVHSASYYALTTLTARSADGVILDADLEVNGGGHPFSLTNECPEGSIDLWNTLTHEAGHLMGLDHASLPQATMYGHSSPCDLHMRDLDPDDVDGYCWLAASFPPTEQTAPCASDDAAPEPALDVVAPGDQAQPEPDAAAEAPAAAEGGCAAGTRAQAAGTASYVLLLAGLVALLRAARISGARHQPGG